MRKVYIMRTYFQTFAGRELYRSSNAVIQQNLSYRWLIFRDQTRIQTLIHRRHPSKAVMPYLKPFTWALRAQPGSTCVLGLGGGAVIHMAAPYLHHHPLTAVEASPEVIVLGRKYFGLNTFQPMTIVQQDAQAFMNETPDIYEHILVDLYSDTGFPATCAAPDFFLQCKQHLQPQGFLALNLVGIQQEFHILEQIKSVFNGATLCIPVPSSANLIVLATHSKSTLMALIESNSKLKAFVWDPLFGYMAKL